MLPGLQVDRTSSPGPASEFRMFVPLHSPSEEGTTGETGSSAVLEVGADIWSTADWAEATVGIISAVTAILETWARSTVAVLIFGVHRGLPLNANRLDGLRDIIRWFGVS